MPTKTGLLRRSGSRLLTKPQDRDLLWYLEVEGAGVSVVRTSSSLSDPRGRLIPEGISILTIDEVYRGTLDG